MRLSRRMNRLLRICLGLGSYRDLLQGIDRAIVPKSTVSCPVTSMLLNRLGVAKALEKETHEVCCRKDGKERDLDVLSEFQMVPRPAWRLAKNFQFAWLHDRRDRRRATARQITSDCTGLMIPLSVLR